MYSPKEVSGDLEIKPDYYPWVDEDFLGKYEKRAVLFNGEDIFLTYRAITAKKVYFAPNLHSDYAVYSAGPKIKQKGNYIRFTYPDGTVIADGSSEPDFDKLQAIRLKKTQ